MKYPAWTSVDIVQRAFNRALNVTASDIRDGARVCGYPVAGNLIQRRVDALAQDFYKECAHCAAMRQAAQARRAS